MHAYAAFADPGVIPQAGDAVVADAVVMQLVIRVGRLAMACGRLPPL